MVFPVTTKYVQTTNGSIAILPDGSVYRITETGAYPFIQEQLCSENEWLRRPIGGSDFDPVEGE